MTISELKLNQLNFQSAIKPSEPTEPTSPRAMPEAISVKASQTSESVDLAVVNDEVIDLAEDKVLAESKGDVIAVADTNLADKTLASQADMLRRYLLASYDLDLTVVRCRRSGSPIYRISDEQLVALWQSYDYDYVEFSTSLEHILAYAPLAIHWVNTSASHLQWLRLNKPYEYLNYCINSLVEDLEYYQSYYSPKRGDLSWEGKFLLTSDFWRFAEEMEKAIAEGYLSDQTLVADLIDKITLLLAIGGASKLKSLTQSEMGFDWFLAELKSKTLAESLTKAINKILNDYRAKHAIHFSARLTIADIEKIASQEKKARLEKDQATRQAMASYYKSRHFQSLKKTSPKDPFLEGLIGELMATNYDKVDYINRLTAKKANQILANKSTSRTNQALANVIRPNNNPVIKAVSLTNLTFTFANKE